MDRILFTRKEFASMTGLCVRTVDMLIANCSLKVVRIGKSVRIPAGEVTRFCKKNHATTRPDSAEVAA
jgi:excisionase family DNA binding protein